MSNSLRGTNDQADRGVSGGQSTGDLFEDLLSNARQLESMMRELMERDNGLRAALTEANRRVEGLGAENSGLRADLSLANGRIAQLEEESRSRAAQVSEALNAVTQLLVLGESAATHLRNAPSPSAASAHQAQSETGTAAPVDAEAEGTEQTSHAGVTERPEEQADAEGAAPGGSEGGGESSSEPVEGDEEPLRYSESRDEPGHTLAPRDQVVASNPDGGTETVAEDSASAGDLGDLGEDGQPTTGDELHEAGSTEVAFSRGDVSPEMEGISTVALVASPLNDLAAVLRFQHAVKQLPEVVEAKPLSFHGGTLRLAVKFAGSAPKVSSLLALPEYDLRLVSLSEDEIELRLLAGAGSVK